MRFFLAGIMQGSLVRAAIHGQDYRGQLKALLETHIAGAKIYDPLANHRDSIRYDEEVGRRVFFDHNAMCRDIDVLIAFVPEASMGTAIEMWEAYQNGAVVLSISPMEHNWAVKFLSHQIYPDLARFEAELISGRVARRIDEVRTGLLGSQES